MFPSRRSVVMARRGMVATSQPLAAQAGLRILQWGGSAADAAVAAAAVLNVVEPMSTGVGGDMFALVHNPATGQTRALNGSGGAGAAATVAKINRLGFDAIPETHHGLAVTVPGAVDGWLTLLEAYGRLSLADVLSPAIYYAEKGFPVSPLIAAAWQRTEEKLQANQAAAQAFLIHGKAPRVGQIFRQPQLAETLRLIARGGREAFYQGFLAEQIAAAVQKNGGLLTTDDLAAHQSVWDEPVSMAYRGHRLVECPPNGQGIVALQTLGILSAFDFSGRQFGHPDVLHHQIEALKLAFADARQFVADPHRADVPLKPLLGSKYLTRRRAMIDPQHASAQVSPGDPLKRAAHADTVYISAVGGDGLAVSFINSLFHSFGAGIVVPGTGICLHNRAALFSLNPDHPNAVAPHKRPYHTIIPALLFEGDDLRLCFGVMGGFMQPQGQVQVVCNVVDFNMDPQQALDAPRFRWLEGNSVAVEPGFDDATLADLQQRGHTLALNAEAQDFGGGQIIAVESETGTLTGASEPRKDGMAVGY